ncbi:hypothetical protein [Proteus phage RP7]|nr:hypothetical protein [Proteus phage RP7]
MEKWHKVVVNRHDIGWGTLTWVNSFYTEKEAKDWISDMEVEDYEREKNLKGTSNTYYTYTYIPLEK